MAHGQTLTVEAMTVRAHVYFTREKKAGRASGMRTRDSIAECLGVGAVTVGRTMAAHRRREPDPNEGKPRAKRGWPMGVEDAQVEPVARNFIAKCAASKRPISAKAVRDELARAGVAQISSRSTRRVLMRLGYQYIHRERRYELANSGDGGVIAGDDAELDAVNV